MTYLYYHQNRNPLGLRRYRKGQQQGEKWEPTSHQWVSQCCPRSACIQTGDDIVDAERAEFLFPGSTKY